MVQEKVFRFNVCYNFAVSESREGAHGRGRYGEPTQRDILGGINIPTHRGRKPLMSGPGMLDPQEQGFLETQVQPEPSYVRKPLFKKGTVLYAATYRNDRPVLPFNEVQAEDLAKEVLEFEQNLEISEKSMGEGKKGREVIKVIGKSTYGAFVEVLIHKKDRKGKDIIEKRFVRLQDRQLARDNPKLRFRNLAR